MNTNHSSDILSKIIQQKTKELNACLAHTSLPQMQQKAAAALPPKRFYQALNNRAKNKQNAVIAEIKKASPSKGVLQANFNPAAIAKSYKIGGATCLSVLTDRHFFQGDNQHLINVKAAVSLPVLRKDFIIDEYQIFEARAIGADAILLITACLDDQQMNEFSAIAKSLSMDVLVEVHNADELHRALRLNLPMIGINNRDLRTFSVSLQTTIGLLSEIDNSVLVITESGILNTNDVKLMRKHNVYSYLVGEAFMRQPNPGKALQEIFE